MGQFFLGWTNTFNNSERNKFCKDIKLHARRAQQLLGQDGEMKKSFPFSSFNHFQIIQSGKNEKYEEVCRELQSFNQTQ